MQVVNQQRPTKRILINPIYKDRVTVLKKSVETDGSYSLGELEVFPGGGNSYHKHKEFVETFTAVDGVLGVMYENRRMYLQPGQSLSIPIGTPHYFFNDTKGKITCQVRFQPGHSGFEKGIAIAYGLAGDGKTTKKGMPKSLVHLSLVMNLTDTRPTGLIGWFVPLFNWIAKRARSNGIEEKLLERYYYE